MTPEALLDRLVPMMLARLPAEQHTAFRAWAKANRDELVEAIREALGGLLEKLRSRASGASDGGIPNAERWSAGERTRANLTAMNIAARLLAEERRPTSNERYALALYSGWGGLSIEGVADKFPPGFPVPEKRGLIHEYYTPGGIAGAVGEAILPLLPGLPRHEDRVAVLEPSAGIGRFIRGLGTRKELDWHAVEWSALSATMLAALYPDIDVFHGPFERWVREQGKDWRGRFGLVLSNPPYGARGSAITVDSDRSFRERKAYAYFLRRGLDMLAPNGLAVFLVPYGFLSGQTDELRALRESILRVAHLSAAYRLPSGIFPGANLVTDLLFFRGRGGTLAEVDETDQGVLAGQYFRAFPKHVLGREVGAGGSDDDQSAKARYGYEVLGEFRGLPPLVERPMCGACAVLQPAAPRAVAEQLRPESELGSAVALALGLAPRLAAYLRDLANDATEQPAQLWRELVDALNAWTSAHGNPHEHRELLTARAAGGPDGEAIATFLSVFTRRGELLAGLREQPVHVPRFQGKAGDLVALAEWVYRQRHHLSWPELAEAAKAQGWRVERERMRELFDAGWCVDGAQWNELEPAEEYLTGALWARYDRAVQQAAAGDEVAAGQARRLLEVIQPVVFDDLTDLSPRDGWIPLDIIERWVSTALQGRFGPVRLARHGGLLQVAGTSYEDLDPSEKGRGVVTADTTWFIGWCNHDRTLFKPKDSSAKIKKEDPDETRLRFETAWNMAFRAWLAVQPTYQRQIEQAYNRHFRGYVAPGSSAEPLQLARWVRKGVRLHAHQNAGARRILRHRGGLLAFDVGVGKTYTGLAILAAARQEGWCKRPVIVVPNSIAWKWYADIRRVLPDYRVAVVGSKRSLAEAPIAAGQVRLAAGARAWADNHPRARTKHQVLNLLKWEWMEASELPEAALTHLKVLADEGAIELKCPQPRVRSGPDTPEERAHKWRQFQLGQVDVVLLTYSMMNRTRLNEESLLHYAEHTSAIQRELELRERNAKKGRGKQSERAQAIADEGAAAWLAQQLELPENNQYDPGIVWDDLNIDLLIVDEAQNFKEPAAAGKQAPPSLPNSSRAPSALASRARSWPPRASASPSRAPSTPLYQRSGPPPPARPARAGSPCGWTCRACPPSPPRPDRAARRAAPRTRACPTGAPAPPPGPRWPSAARPGRSRSAAPARAGPDAAAGARAGRRARPPARRTPPRSPAPSSSPGARAPAPRRVGRAGSRSPSSRPPRSAASAAPRRAPDRSLPAAALAA